MYFLLWILLSDVGIQLEKEMDPGESRVILNSPGSEHHSQQPLTRMIWLLVYCGSLSTDVDTGGSDASIAVVRSHHVNLGTNGDGACRDSLASLSVGGTCCRVDRDRTAT